MEVDELLEGSELTGRQAAIIFFGFLLLIILAAVLLVIFSDFFRGLVSATSPTPGGIDAVWIRGSSWYW